MMGAYNRDISLRKALRKKRISDTYHLYQNHDPWFDNVHQYSKNKIHCSCHCCSTKTRNKGRRQRGNYRRSINYKKADLIQMMSMDDQMYDYDGIKIHRRYKNW